jgi:hypothetical protein
MIVRPAEFFDGVEQLFVEASWRLRLGLVLLDELPGASDESQLARSVKWSADLTLFVEDFTTRVRLHVAKRIGSGIDNEMLAELDRRLRDSLSLLADASEGVRLALDQASILEE